MVYCSKSQLFHQQVNILIDFKTMEVIGISLK